MKRRTGQCGLTLVELLVAGTIMVLILSALGSLFISTSRAYRVNDELSERQQSADAAAQLLSYEIGLAGYRGSTREADSKTFASSTLTLTKGTSDTVEVRYYEDRFVDAAEELIVTFSVTSDILYRRQVREKISAEEKLKITRQPAIQNVQNLKVLRYIRKDGSEGSTATSETLAALRLELTFTDGLKKQVVIGINNPQQAPVFPTL